MLAAILISFQLTLFDNTTVRIADQSARHRAGACGGLTCCGSDMPETRIYDQRYPFQI